MCLYLICFLFYSDDSTNVQCPICDVRMCSFRDPSVCTLYCDQCRACPHGGACLGNVLDLANLGILKNSRVLDRLKETSVLEYVSFFVFFVLYLCFLSHILIYVILFVF